MGILNVTPDSFYDGGRLCTTSNAISHALQMIKEGADIIDIGGESTRPGAKAISIEEECDRIFPVITALKKETNTPISIDSRHASVIRGALQRGANMVNDVSALQNKESLSLVAHYKVPICLMHMQGSPGSMQKNPTYHNVLDEVYHFLRNRIEACEKVGMERKNIWIDPGFGFGKTLAHNLTLLRNISFFKTLGCAILVGLSRKSMFGEILNKPVNERLYGSLAGAMVALMQGASIIRTHDVAPTKDILAVANALQSQMENRIDVGEA